MITKKGWKRYFMASLFKKEDSYNAGVVMDDTNACSLLGFELEPSWEDEIATDKDEVTGKEFGSDQEIIQQAVKLTYREPKAKPNSLIGFSALALGNITSTQDGTYTAYKHKIIPVTVGNALPSIQVEEKTGEVQYKYTGIKANSIKISGEAGKLISLEVELLGSGNRETSSTAFASAISESWLKVANCKVWMENGSNISIAASLTQGSQDISSGTPTDLGVRFQSFEFNFNNNLEGQPGFGGNGIFQDIDYGRRAATLSFSLLFNDATELNHYLSQNPLAIEFDLKGALIATGGTMYYGFHLIIPRFKLKTAPIPKGGVDDFLTCDFDCEIFDDGTNPAVIIEGYNAISAYLT